MIFIDEIQEHDFPHSIVDFVLSLHPDPGESALDEDLVDRVPTHTEDGIPIRKLYVSNLPPKTTRNEIFELFAQYGFIQSCWVRHSEKNEIHSIPPYAFITFIHPEDAYKALLAPSNEKYMRGRRLKIQPADSWHQPIEDANGQVQWKQRTNRNYSRAMPTINLAPKDGGECSTDNMAVATTTQAYTQESEIIEQVETEGGEPEPLNIMDILNQDCLDYILSLVPIQDLVLSERVSKRWRAMVLQYIRGFRTFKTTWWKYQGTLMTTAVLRRLLQKFGSSLTRLDIDNPWSALNDRTAHSIAKFCPNLETLQVTGLQTKRWNPLVYSCKNLKSLSFVSCTKLTDASLVTLVKHNLNLETLLVTNNSHVTGLFLNGGKMPSLRSVTFDNCCNLQGTVICAALQSVPNLKVLALDSCTPSIWRMLPRILEKLPQLEELSLCEYTTVEEKSLQPDAPILDAIGLLTQLKSLDLSGNVNVSNHLIKKVAETATKLHTLKVACCNTRSNNLQGVTDEGIYAIVRGCPELREIDVSYLRGLTDAGVASLAACTNLLTVVCCGNTNVSGESFAKCLKSCRYLETLDVCGCDNVGRTLISEAVKALDAHPRPLRLYLASTEAAECDDQEIPRHKSLCVDLEIDHCVQHLRPDFVDRIFDSSDTTLDDYDDIFDMPNQFSSDDEDDDDDYDYENMIDWEIYEQMHF